LVRLRHSHSPFNALVSRFRAFSQPRVPEIRAPHSIRPNRRRTSANSIPHDRKRASKSTSAPKRRRTPPLETASREFAAGSARRNGIRARSLQRQARMEKWTFSAIRPGGETAADSPLLAASSRPPMITPQTTIAPPKAFHRRQTAPSRSASTLCNRRGARRRRAIRFRNGVRTNPAKLDERALLTVLGDSGRPHRKGVDMMPLPRRAAFTSTTSTVEALL